MLLTHRSPWLLGFAAAVFAMLFALYLQHFQDLHPCSMCVFERVAMIATGVAFLVAGLIGPKGWGRFVAGLAAFLSAVAGAAIAARHVWLQNLPEDQVPACGAGLNAMLDVFPLAEVIKLVLSGDGNCAEIDWTFLGLSLPAWAMIGFVVLALWALLSIYLSRRAAEAIEEYKTRAIEAAAFRRLLAHLDSRKDVQNIELMNLADFCRNCLSRWYREEAEVLGKTVSDANAREIIYGMPYSEWKEKHQTPATPEQLAVMNAKKS